MTTQKKSAFTLAKGTRYLSRYKSAFTLAEVLITLGIIGVVAAMTIPTLIANTRSQQYRSQFKKTLSTLNQAVLMAQAQYDINFSDIKSGCNSEQTDNPQTDKTFCAIINGTLQGFSVPNYEIGDSFSDAQYRFDTISPLPEGAGPLFLAEDYSRPGTGIQYLLSDGSLILMYEFQTECSNSGDCVVLIDVNGKQPPNKEVTCEGGRNKTIGNADYKDCTVPNDAEHMGDIFPVFIYNSTAEPATNAARYVLNTAK